MSDAVSLADVERLCWRLSGWRVEQRDVDALLAAVESYARSAGAMARETCEVPREPGAQAGGPQGAVSEPEPVHERPAEPSVMPEPSQTVNGPQTGVQSRAIAETLSLDEGAYVLTVTRVAKPVPPVRTPSRPDPSPGTRTCRKCGITYPLEKFSRDKTSKGGRKTACTLCENIRRRDARRIKRAAERAAKGA